MRTLDYWLNRLFYDLHTDRKLALEYRADRASILSGYPISPAIRDAVIRNDVAELARVSNPFLVRYYFFLIGMGEQDFIEGLQALKGLNVKEQVNG